MAKVFKNIVLNGYNGEPMRMAVRENDGDPIELKEAKLDSVMRIILNNAPLQTQQDSINGMRLAMALDKAKNGAATIEIEDGVHDWLKPVAEKLTPSIFRVNGNLVYKHICEGFEKAHQSQDQKGVGR
ncbi:hypothetical protein LCGC14_0902140 [marine sediment metagenome]|uniref:Uncharacterized protein n=1 Tax=marine sediment metagenome TaxID=412755 RepID=A0A0F9S2Z8_9ZZZZ